MIIEKKMIDKNRDKQLTGELGLDVGLTAHSKVDSAEYPTDSCLFVQPLESFGPSRDPKRLSSFDDNQRFNELRVTLRQLKLPDLITKKSPLVRIEACLRDNYGQVYDSIYQTISDKREEYKSSYESQIFQGAHEVNLSETFLIRIPTKSIDALKRLFILFFIETVDKQHKKVAKKKEGVDMTKVEFKPGYLAIVPLYDTHNESVI